MRFGETFVKMLVMLLYSPHRAQSSKGEPSTLRGSIPKMEKPMRNLYTEFFLDAPVEASQSIENKVNTSNAIANDVVAGHCDCLTSSTNRLLFGGLESRRLGRYAENQRPDHLKNDHASARSFCQHHGARLCTYRELCSIPTEVSKFPQIPLFADETWIPIDSAGGADDNGLFVQLGGKQLYCMTSAQFQAVTPDPIEVSSRRNEQLICCDQRTRTARGLNYYRLDSGLDVGQENFLSVETDNTLDSGRSDEYISTGPEEDHLGGRFRRRLEIHMLDCGSFPRPFPPGTLNPQPSDSTEYALYCKNMGGDLCYFDDLCPFGNGEPTSLNFANPPIGAFTGVDIVPVLNESSALEWTQLGHSDDVDVCQSSSGLAQAVIHESAFQHIICCFD